MSSEFTNIISQGGQSLMEDNRAKALFSLKPVIARIAQACVPELRDLSCKIIAEECLESFHSPSGDFSSDFAKVLSTERPLPNSFHITCDLLFELHPPKSIPVKWKPQLLNIEIQNDSQTASTPLYGQNRLRLTRDGRLTLKRGEIAPHFIFIIAQSLKIVQKEKSDFTKIG